MSKIDTNNSKFNLNCIANELFNELTPEAAEVIQGGTAFLYDDFGKRRLLGRFERSKRSFSDAGNDKTSVIRITEGNWRFYEHAEYGGLVMDLPPGTHYIRGWWNDKISGLQKIS